MPTPDHLTPAQAVDAVALLFASLPAEAWEGRRKPSLERVRSIVLGLRDSAPFEMRPILDGMIEPGSNESISARGDVARLVLGSALSTPLLAAHAEKAIETASKPHMGIDPTTGVVVVAMLLATSRLERKKDGTFKVELGAGAESIIRELRLPELVKEIAHVLRALPKSLLARLSGSEGSPFDT